MRLPPFDKLAFVGSLVAIAFLYGIATQTFGWFPSSYLRRAWNQAEAQLDWLGDRDDVHWRAQRTYSKAGIRIVEPGKIGDGYTLLSSHWEDLDWMPALKLIDRQGNVVHRWWIRNSARLRDSLPSNLDDVNIHGSELLPNGDAVIVLGGTAIARLDACSRVKWWRSIKGHHALSVGRDSTFWAATWSDTLIDDGVTEMFRRDNIGETNKVTRLSRDGRVIDKISVLAVLQSSGLLKRVFTERHYRYNGDEHIRDLTHLNDVEVLSGNEAAEYPLFDPGDLLLSFKRLNLVLVIDPDSRVVKWHSGPKHPIIRQHDPDFIGSGWIGIYNNAQDGSARGHRLGGSEIVAIQPSTDSVKTLFAPENHEDFYAGYGGKWQYLKNGNMLITEMPTGRVFEVTKNGQVVWEWIQGNANRATVSEVPEGTRYDYKQQTIESWPCSSDVRSTAVGGDK